MILLDRIRSRLDHKLILNILLFSGLLTLIITAVQLYIEYRRDMNTLDVRFAQIEKSFLKPLSSALWRYSDELIEAQLDGIRQLRDIEYLEITEGGETIAAMGEKPAEEGPTRSFPLTYRYKGETRTLGTLTASASYDGIHARLYDRVVIILLSAATKTFATAIFMLFLFRMLVIRHLEKIVAYFRSYTLSEAVPPLRLEIPEPHSGAGDEIHRIEVEINRLIDAIRGSYETARQRFETFFSLASDLFCIADIDGRFRLVNPAAVEILGYSREELLARPFLEFIHPDDREPTREVIESQLKQGLTVPRFLNRYIRKDGAVRWLEWTSHPLIDQGITYAVARDATERIGMEEALKKSELWMRNIFNTLEEAVLVVSPDRKLLNMNKAVREIFGYTEAELRRRSTEILHVDRDHYTAFGERIREAFDRGVSAEFEFSARRKNGEVFPTEHTVSLLKDDAGRTLGIVSVVRDISRKKASESALQRTLRELERSNAELEQFAYVASHDLQEPLRAIAGFLQLLQGRYGDKLDEKGHHYIDRAVTAAGRMQTLIHDILALSRVSTRGGEFVPTDLNAVLKKTLETLEPAIRKSGARITHAPLPSAAVDANQIQSLLQNLIQNGIKYVRDESPVIDIGCEEIGDAFRLFVKDNGIGIDPRFHERVFLVFQRLHTAAEYSGTGIGLAICRKIAERHGGRIWVESESGNGAAFYFTLPKRLES